jgi:hypothetical protein
VGEPFAAIARALDAGGNPIPAFAGAANLSAAIVTTRPPIGTDPDPSDYPFYASDTPSVRLQTVYPAGTLGGAGRLTALALNISQLPGGDFSNWTIRLKHTTKSISTLWETSGWTVVHVSNAKFANTGWVTFPFQMAFDYDGTSNLFVDLSYRNPALGFSFTGRCASSFTVPDGPRALRGSSMTVGSDPLTWANVSNSQGTASTIVNVRFTTAQPIAMQPAAAVPFVNGVWSGNISIATPGTSIGLRADDGAGHVGDSGVFTVTSADADGDGLPDAWAAQYGVHGAFGDPDNDGLCNLLELALGLSPIGADVLPPPQLVPDPNDGRTYLTWHYRRLLNPKGLTYAVEASEDLVTWHAGVGWLEETGVSAPEADGLTQTVSVRALPPIGTPGATRRHLRLRVTAP